MRPFLADYDGLISHQDLLKVLKCVRHFQHRANAELDRILSAGSLRHASEGEVIFLEGEPSASLFVLLKGRVHLCKLRHDGQESILSVITPVTMFNEVATLDEETNSITAKAADDSVFWWTEAASFAKCCLSILKWHSACSGC